jgi:small subunit ribosomal protein S15
MGRIHTHRKGKSHPIRPTSKRIPSWINYSIDEIDSIIVKLAKDGLTSSKIGTKLRDEYGVPLVKPILGKSIVEVLKSNNTGPTMPEDIERLLIKAKKLQEHLNVHKGDRINVRSLELIEAKIHRLSKYYKNLGILPSEWKYSTIVAQLA